MSNGEELKSIAELAKVAELASREFRQVAGSFLAPIARAGGEYIADRIQFARVENATRAFIRARSILAQTGLEMQPVPLKLLAPIAEGASVEEDEEMRELWARLLATVASGVAIPPSFPRILADLSPLEARLLKTVADAQTIDPETRGSPNDPRAIERVRSATNASDGEFSVALDNLIRLRLVALSAPSLVVMSPEPPRPDESQRAGLTSLGAAFVEACEGPMDVKGEGEAG